MTAKRKTARTTLGPTAPLFTREDYLTESRVLSAAAVLMDGRSFRARQYRKLAAMLVFADVWMPAGLPRRG